jgi:hypothetical protein
MFGGGGVHVCSTASFVASSPRTAALTSKQDTIPFLTRLVITLFALLLTFLKALSFCSARYTHRELLSSAGRSMWVSSFPEGGKGATRKKRPLPDSIYARLASCAVAVYRGESSYFAIGEIPDRPTGILRISRPALDGA